MTAPLFVSFGGGVNSAALLIGLRDRGVVPDAILFADTGAELPHTYAFIEQMQERLKAWNFPPLEVVRKLYRKQFEGLEGDCLRKKMLPGLAYGTRSCSIKYKGDILDTHLRRWIKARKAEKPARKAIGYDAGEPWRSNKVSPNPELWTAWYPLVEWGWDRAKCVEVLAAEGLAAGKSSCFFCPAMKKGEVIKLAEEYPDYMARALAMEEAAFVGHRSAAARGLGGTYRWSELLQNDKDQARFDFRENPFIPCGCVE